MWTLWEWIYRFELAPAGVGRAGCQTSPCLLRFATLQIGARVQPLGKIPQEGVRDQCDANRPNPCLNANR